MHFHSVVDERDKSDGIQKMGRNRQMVGENQRHQTDIKCICNLLCCSRRKAICRRVTCGRFFCLVERVLFSRFYFQFSPVVTWSFSHERDRLHELKVTVIDIHLSTKFHFHVTNFPTCCTINSLFDLKKIRLFPIKFFETPTQVSSRYS